MQSFEQLLARFSATVVSLGGIFKVGAHCRIKAWYWTRPTKLQSSRDAYN